MGKDLESRQAQMREHQVRPTNRAKRLKPSDTEDERKLSQTQPQTRKEKEVVSIIKLIEKRLRARKKLPMEELQKLQEFTRCPELADLLNDLLPPLREVFETHLFVSKLLDSDRRQKLRYYEFLVKRAEIHQVKTERKPSLDYYDWNTEDHYDWIDHYEQFGPREEIVRRRNFHRQLETRHRPVERGRSNS